MILRTADHQAAPRGCSSMAEHQLPKLTVRVRFPSPAPHCKAPGQGWNPRSWGFGGADFLGGEAVAVPASWLGERFLTLGTRLAGKLMQKFVTYRLRLAVIGDIFRHLAVGPALHALVHESNQADHMWLLPDVDALDTRLLDQTRLQNVI
jgi:hypothetical protein